MKRLLVIIILLWAGVAWPIPPMPGTPLGVAGGAQPYDANLQSYTETITAGGTADALTASFTMAATLVEGLTVVVQAASANATTTPSFTPTFNSVAQTTHTITKTGNVALVAGDIKGAGHYLILRYNLAGTRWELLNPANPGSAKTDSTTASHFPYVNSSGAIVDGTMSTGLTDTAGTLTVTGVKSPATTGQTTITGPAAGQTRAKTVSDADATIAEIAQTVITKSEYLPIRYAEDDDSVTAPAAVTEIGTTTLFARSFAEDTDNGVVFWWHIPVDYSAGIKFRVYFATDTNAGADETAVFNLSGCAMASSGALACSEGTGQEAVLELTANEDTGELLVSGWSAAITIGGSPAAGQMAKLLLIRDVTGGGTEDDMVGHALVTAIEVKYQAKLNASTDY